MGFLLSNYQLTICILYSLIFCLSSSSAHLCHNDESTALLQFKQLFSFDCSVSSNCFGYSAPLTDNWKEGTDCCAWNGVTCDNTTAHVIGLDLYCSCLYGTIHPNSSLFNLVHLQQLELSYNNFNHSQILPSFGRFTNLTHLYLRSSHLSGPIQSSEEEVWQGNNFFNSIFHLQKLQDLWLGGNRELTGKIPSFINGTLRHLRSLDLTSTGFTGELPNSIGQLEYLEKLHLHDCNFSGTLPSKYFESMHSMMDDEDKSSLNYIRGDVGYYYSVTVMNKGLEMELVKIITIFKAIDFSHNKFHGHIPISIGRLKGLCVLNFSGNGLTGLIPVSLGDLTQLESLDLSQNKLFGEIPPQLTKLTFLEVLNFSQNNLTGLIPRGGQFETFLNTSYEGNLGLCGFPLSKNCGNVQTPELPTLPSLISHNFKFKFDGFGWEAVLMGYGCGVLLGLLIGSYIIRRKEEWLVRIFGTKMRQHGKRSKKVWKKIAHTKSIINCL
ncbi:Receptor-like protein 34 [Camellia lanceoleosa]|uniref:Receptor-like protein 34 n=1 Tax=Camellia lanceoleosa TaxID=1840588 RepID=A0ACC0FP39_9ERIC|nr:Receptor-like protein 34 [Camellia lanceoleosa]